MDTTAFRGARLGIGLALPAAPSVLAVLGAAAYAGAVAGRDFEFERSQTQLPVEQAQPEQELSPAERLASNVGNQAFGALAREGAGILPDGRAHPDVESTIAQTRGGGGSLDAGVAQRMGPALGDDLSDVRVHTDDTADALASSVSARAFTTGNDVYFAKGEYAPGSGSGDQLLAHELSHVVQQRGAPTSGPLQVSMPGDALEADADQATKGITD